MNIERPTSNDEKEKMKKTTYDLSERLLLYSVRMVKNDALYPALFAQIGLFYLIVVQQGR
jgi:hypothetical protein